MKKLKNVLLLVLPLVLSSCGDSVSKEENTNDTDIKENVDVVDENNTENNNQENTENNIDDTNEEINISYETKEAGIVNNAVADYRIESEYLTIYTVETSKLPHVDIIDFLSDLDGFFDFKNVRNSYDKEKEELSLYYRNTYNILFDVKNDVIKADSCFTFLQYCYEAASTDYSEHILEYTDYYVKKSTFNMDLKEYGFDIIYIDNKCLVPLFLANLLFCSFAYYNVLYNNDLVFLEYGEPSEIFGYDDCDDKGKSQDLEYRKEVVNSLYLIFDYYYGLNGYKKFDNGIKEEISKLNNGKVLENLLFSDGYRNLLSYIDIIYTFLDELHSRIDVPSFYWNKANEVSINRGSFGKSYYEIGS